MVLALHFIAVVVLLAGTCSAGGNFTSYLFAYFTGEGKTNGESISFAVSAANDALSWKEIRNGQPILMSNVGTKGVRDPTLIRSPDGSKFWILATDLKMYKSGMTWGSASRQGSRSIVIWESTDLVKWVGPRLAEVSPPIAGNTRWAPEAIWDGEKYHVLWSSSLYSASDKKHEGKSHHRIMKATTTDFVEFSPAVTYLDVGYSVIDTTMVHDQSSKKFYRFTKDERVQGSGPDRSATGKFIFEEFGDTIDGKWTMIKKGIGQGMIKQGEGPLIFRDNARPDKWYMFIDEFGGRGYVPFETTKIDKAEWKMVKQYSLPKSPRHGSVIGITEEERNRVLAM